MGIIAQWSDYNTRTQSLTNFITEHYLNRTCYKSCRYHPQSLFNCAGKPLKAVGYTILDNSALPTLWQNLRVDPFLYQHNAPVHKATSIRNWFYDMGVDELDWPVQGPELCVCVCANANPLHYYALQIPHKVDRWCSVWSIFESRTAWADHITCGTSICIVYCRKLRLGWLYV